MTAAPRVIPEFSRLQAADSIGSQAQRREIVANAAEREALARRFGLLSLERLTAALELRRHAGEVISLTGHLVSDVVQSCVVSLAPVPAHIEVDFESSYSPAEVELPAIDVDPYPRAPGAELPPGGLAEPEDQTGKKRPFAALAALKKRP